MIYDAPDEIGEFNNRVSGFESTLSDAFRNLGEVTARYHWKHVAFTPDADGRGLSRFRGNIGAVSVGSRIDTLDEFPFPTTGSMVRLTYALADKAFGGETNFSRAFASYHPYFSPFTRHTFSVNVRAGSDWNEVCPNMPPICCASSAVRSIPSLGAPFPEVK